jgi:hypothetical protein
MEHKTYLELLIGEVSRVDERGGAQSVCLMNHGHSRNERTARVRKWSTIPTQQKMLKATSSTRKSEKGDGKAIKESWKRTDFHYIMY